MRAADLELDWEVGVFRAVRALWRRVAPERLPYDPARVARLEDDLGALGPLAQLVAGEPVRVLVARGEGGVRGRDLLVPEWIDDGPDAAASRALLRLRVVHAATTRRLLAGRRPPPDPIDRLVAGLEAVAAGAALAAEELARFGSAWAEACAVALAGRPAVESLRGRARVLEQARRALLSGEPLPADLAASLRAAREQGPPSPPVPLWGAWIATELDDHSTGDASADPGRTPDGSEAQAPPVEELRRVLLDPKAAEEKVLQHTFEKVETLDSWEGNRMPDDGSDELDEHLEALQEVDLRDLVRGGQDAASLYKADLDLGADVPDVESIAPSERGIPYDEWDHRAGRYRPGWCTVYPSAIPRAEAAWAAAPRRRNRRLVEDLRRRLEDHRSTLRPRDRQLDGEQPDIDALVDRYGEIRAGRTGDARLYLRQERQRRDFATTVLLDVSLSADAWVDDRRVLDVSREAVLVLGDVADRLDDRVQVLAFASSTRNRCRVWTVKGWAEPWAVGVGRLGAIEPQGYTRIGPALRHAIADLAATPADQRLLLLISDGKPNDYDRYEGRYGMADVRMALREGDARGVNTHALAIDVAARGYLPPMFGPGRWHVVPHAQRLLPALTTVYGQLTGR
jgi:nitric oxide reductase NorD protein